MKRALLLPNGVKANRIRAALARLEGYPKDGVDIGGGIHMPAAQSRTLQASSLVTLPDGRVAVVAPERVLLRIGEATETRDVEVELVDIDPAWFADDDDPRRKG